MEIKVTIQGIYSDGQKFYANADSIEKAIEELEMVEVNENAFNNTPPSPAKENYES